MLLASLPPRTWRLKLSFLEVEQVFTIAIRPDDRGDSGGICEETDLLVELECVQTGAEAV